MNHPWLFLSGSIAALLVGIAAAGGFLHVGWWIEERQRRRRRDAVGTVDLTGVRQ